MEPFDRFDDVPVPDQWADIVRRAGPLSDPLEDDEWAERSRSRRRRSAWVLIGAAAAVLGMTAGFLVIDRDGVRDDAASDVVRSPTSEIITSLPGAQISTPSPEPAIEVVDSIGDRVEMPCRNGSDLAEIAALVRSGQPTFDFEPARDVTQLIEWSDVVVAGELVSAGRRLTPNNEWYTDLELTNVEVLAGDGAVDRIRVSSVWSVLDEPDPLVPDVDFEGVRFVAFLDAIDSPSGAWEPYADGLAFGCVGTAEIAESLAGLPSDLEAMSIDEVIAETRRVAEREVGGITRPVFPEAACRPLSARDFGRSTGRSSVFFPRDEVFPIQIVGAPGGTTEDPFALIQRWDESTDPVWVTTDAVTIGDLEVKVATVDNGNGEAAWVLRDGSIGYLRSRGLSRSDIEAIVGSLAARPLDDPIPGFDLAQIDKERFELLHEQINTEVSASGATSECRAADSPWIYRIYVVNGDPVGRFAAVIDRAPPRLVGEIGPTTVIIEGPDDPGGLGIDDVIDASAERFDGLTDEPTIAEQDNTPPDVALDGELEHDLMLFDATGDGVADQAVTLRVVVAEEVSFLEISWDDFEAHPDAVFNVVEIKGGGAGASAGGMSTLIDGSTSAFRLGPADATEPFVLTVKIVDSDERVLQLSPTIRVVPE